MRTTAIAALAAGILVLAGCGAGAGNHPTRQGARNHQAVHGMFVRAGGPAPGSPVPLPGTITARAATGATFTATAGRNGRFTLSLPAGSYHVTGHSPLMQSGQMTCTATAQVRVSRSKPSRPVIVVCPIP